LSTTCDAQIWDNPFSDYIERDVTINPGAGNGHDANAAIHTIDPWPAYAGNTRIPGSGRSAVCAIYKMYRNPDPFFSPLFTGGNGATGAPIGGNVSIGNTTTTTGGAGAEASELSGCY
jgi:hypothetical protein